MQKRIKRMMGNGVGLMVGSMATSKLGTLAGKPEIESNIQSGLSMASTGNLIEGAGAVNDSLKRLYKRRR